MNTTFFNTIFDNTASITLTDFLLCLGVSLLIGLFLAGVSSYKTRYTQSFFITMVLLPAIVCVVIMMVNGNIGTGVAVAGAFSLVRFRSIPGTAKEIGTIFLSMGAGLMAGMGYIAYAILFALILGLVSLILHALGVGSHSKPDGMTLRITIPEDLNYTDAFKDLFDTYTTKASLDAVKTTNMGSMFRLTYAISLKSDADQKEFLDALRCRNGNLEISLLNDSTAVTEL
ncbi:DUF4956 domain-containing protein [Clostridium sp. OF10-22XD]|nr:DUF4956 domain-containing protein [Clostridium sp. OF10-22XD]